MKINQHKQIIFNSLKNYAPDIYAYVLKKINLSQYSKFKNRTGP